MFLLNLNIGPPVLLPAAGTLIAILIAGLITARRRRAKARRQLKNRARTLFIEVRRACTLPGSAISLNQIPGLVKIIRSLAEKAGLQLSDIGASDKQLERFLLTAKDGKIPERRNTPVRHSFTAEDWLVATARSSVPGKDPHIIEFLPDNGGAIARDLPELPADVIIGFERPAKSAAPPADQEPDIDRMFDLITRSDEAALAAPAQAIKIIYDRRSRRGPKAIELAPDDGREMVLTATRDPQPASEIQSERCLDFDQNLPELGDEIIIESEERLPRSEARPPANEAVLEIELPDGSSAAWSCRQDPVPIPDPPEFLAVETEVNRLFDRITMSDEEARSHKAEIVMIRVDGKKYGL